MILRGPALAWARQFAAGAGLACLASGLWAQTDDRVAAAEAAETRLDFRAAYELLGQAIRSDPAAAQAYIARAGLHEKLGRTALALADLARAGAAAPDDPQAYVLAGQILRRHGAPRQAIAAFDEALARNPDHLPALAGRAGANADAGLAGAALADYARALALAPGDATLTAEREALRTAQNARRVAQISYDPAALMAPEFRIEEGVAQAPHHLVIIEAGSDLAPLSRGPQEAALAAALEAGRLRVTRMFTYTGQDAAIWANLALICGGAEGYHALHPQLAGEAGRFAIAAIDKAGDLAPLRALVSEAYVKAGLPGDLVETCAFSRVRAVRYLANWSETRDGFAWKGVDVYDHWPVYVWDDTPRTAEAVAAQLAALATPDAAPPEQMTPATMAQVEPAPGPAPVVADDAAARLERAPQPEPDQPEPAADAQPPGADSPPPDAQAPDPQVQDETDRQATLPLDADQPEPAADTAPALVDATEFAPATSPRPISRPLPTSPPEGPPPSPAVPGALLAPVTAQERVPGELRGVYGASLVECIAFTDRVAGAETLDGLLPGLNPLDGPVIGTVLLTSRRMQLFNATGTECGLSAISGPADDAPWQGELACANALAPGILAPLTLTRLPADGPAPRLLATLGSAEPVELVQCRPLGRLGRDAAPLWHLDTQACAARAPVRDTQFLFRVNADGHLVLRVRPTAEPAAPPALPPRLVLDASPWPAAPGAWQDGAWQFDLGRFAEASNRLSLGLFLEVQDQARAVLARLPLLGSSASMSGLAGCAPQQAPDAAR